MRDWAALPRDVQFAIFRRIPHADLLGSAGLVCRSWRRLSTEEPTLWQHIDLASDDEDSRKGGKIPAARLAMARAAVDRSAGRCESFRGPADFNFLAYLAARAPSLKSLHLTSELWRFERSEHFVDDVARKIPQLERLVLSRGFVEKDVLCAFLDHCPRLELLDAGGCVLDVAMGSRLRERFHRTIRMLKLPQPFRRGACCGCCWEYAQRYAEEHDR